MDTAGKRDGSAHSTRQNMMMAMGVDGVGAGPFLPCLDSKERPGRKQQQQQLEGEEGSKLSIIAYGQNVANSWMPA